MDAHVQAYKQYNLELSSHYLRNAKCKDDISQYLKHLVKSI